jgi:RNA-directed DNA polymerase
MTRSRLFAPNNVARQSPFPQTGLRLTSHGDYFSGQVIKPWRRQIRRRTFNEALARVAAADPADVYTSANSYFGLLRQATASHHDRARLANLVRSRGHAVDGVLTKAFRIKSA